MINIITIKPGRFLQGTPLTFRELRDKINALPEAQLDMQVVFDNPDMEHLQPVADLAFDEDGNVGLTSYKDSPTLVV